MRINNNDIFSMASAIRRLCMAASANLNADCFLHAALGYKLFEQRGVEAQFRVGFAAWRVGSGDGDVITHRPSENSVYFPGSLPVHAWLEVGGFDDSAEARIVDFTTYQLHSKAAALDAMDGGSTLLEWAPEVLVVPISSTSSFHEVAQGNVGQYYYEFSHEITAELRDKVMDVDASYLPTLSMLIAAPSMRVIGPNHRDWQ